MGRGWRSEAACVGVDPELFFPVGEGPLIEWQVAEAKAVCRGCPVIVECRAWALQVGEDFGVWGGLDAEERRELRRRELPKAG
ncbi:WhiB family transcriptional regulator [Longimycelium tulufanense]|uniref:WhiB family transcriptional regulator n=1 Tax=Longimycelium tulufanense TaxID=907463 RepID=UPI001E38C8DB|nr:WhiB family transcriptional regulator [Longimycelium tulufanense]